MHWSSWSGLEIWPYFNHFGHFYNTAPGLPNWLVTIFHIIITIQVIPILSCLNCVQSHGKDEILAGIQTLFYYVIYLAFIPWSYLAVTLLIIMLFILIFFAVNSKLQNGILLQNGTALLLRCLVEIVSPILFILSGATTQRIVNVYWSERQGLPFMIIALVATIGFLIVFSIQSYFRSRTVFMRPHFFETWNSSFLYIGLVGAVVVIQFWTFATRYKYGQYVTHGVSAIVLIALFIEALNLPYVKAVVNIMSIGGTLWLFLMQVICLFGVGFPDLSPSITLLILGICLIISFIVSIVAFNARIRVLLNVVKNTSEEEEEEEAQEQGVRLRLLDRGEGEDVDFFTSKWDVLKLRQLYVSDKKLALKFATFLLGKARDRSALLESFRILTLMNKIPISHVIEVADVEIGCQQLLCDIQYRANAALFTDDAIDELIEYLEGKALSIRRTLNAIADCIQMANKKDAFIHVKNYSRECNEYEKLAAFILVHCPFSKKIDQNLAVYFNTLRGDMEKGQMWLQNTGGMKRSSSSFTGYRGRLSACLSSSKLQELGGVQRYNSQRALQKVHSQAIRGAILFHVLALIVALVFIFYRYNANTLEFITSPVVCESGYRISTFPIAPLYNLFRLMSQIIIACDSTTSQVFENLFNQVVLPFDSVLEHIYTSLEWISEAIMIVDKRFEEEINAYHAYSSPLPGTQKSLQVLLSQVHRVTGFLREGKCTKEDNAIATMYLNKIQESYDPLLLLNELVRGAADRSIKMYAKNFLRDYLVLILVLLLFLSIAFYYVWFATRSERNKFWSEFRELDLGDLEKFQSSLMVAQDKVESNPNDDPNVLSPDEIEAPETERLLLSNEVTPLGKPKRRFNFYPLVTVVCFLLFAATPLVYHQPFTLTLQADRALARVSTYLQGRITLTTFTFLEMSRQALYSVVPWIEEQETALLLGLDDVVLEDYDFDADIATYPSFLENGVTFEKRLTELEAAAKKYEEEWRGFGVDEAFFSLGFLVFTNFTGLSKQISEWYFEKHDDLDQLRVICSHTVTLFLMIITIAYFTYIILTIADYSFEFESLKSLIILLPSQYYASTANIIEKFRPHSQKNVGNKRFRSRYIIKHSVNSIIVIDSNRLIQDVNKATLELFGYKRDVLIRTDLTTLFMSNDHQSDDFFAQLTFMNRQATTQQGNNSSMLSHNVREFNLMAVPADGEPIPVNCTLIPIGDNDTGSDSPAFAVLLRDRSAFLQQDILYRNMQNQVESLLLRIMPRVMVMKLLSKNQVLHSQVNRATFLFIGIWQFVDWCKSHTHTEIMELLDVVVSAFDKRISAFPSLVKIKIINGVYMAAGGLFEEVSEKPHEVEMVEFAIKCIKWMRKRNRMTQSDIQLQIGINTGGPIIAGILGHDKPFFDVYGDAVNVAARLETSCPTDCIQISQEMRKAIPDGMFQLEERPNVYLKGKGYETTYIVHVK